MQTTAEYNNNLLKLNCEKIEYFNNLFKLNCEKGNIKVAKWLYELGVVDIHAQDEEVFISSCRLGHVEIAKWLYGLGGINIHDQLDGRTFGGSGWEMFFERQMNVAKWLCSVFPQYQIEITNNENQRYIRLNKIKRTINDVYSKHDKIEEGPVKKQSCI
jgi:hypothetical protein